MLCPTNAISSTALEMIRAALGRGVCKLFSVVDGPAFHHFFVFGLRLDQEP